MDSLILADALGSSLRNIIPNLSPDERVATISKIMDGYCMECGDALNTPAWLAGRGGYCNCDNDE